MIAANGLNIGGTADVTAEDRCIETIDAIGHIDMAEPPPFCFAKTKGNKSLETPRQ